MVHGRIFKVPIKQRIIKLVDQLRRVNNLVMNYENDLEKEHTQQEIETKKLLVEQAKVRARAEAKEKQNQQALRSKIERARS